MAYTLFLQLSLPLANDPFLPVLNNGHSLLENSEITYLKLNSYDIVHKPQNILPLLVCMKKLNYLRLGYGEVITPLYGLNFRSEPITNFCLMNLTTLHLDCQIIPHAEFGTIAPVCPNLSTIVLEGSPAFGCNSKLCKPAFQKKENDIGRPVGPVDGLSICVDNFARYAASLFPKLTSVISKVPNGVFTACFDLDNQNIVFKETKFTFCEGELISVKMTKKFY